jgi:hypothetical protein
MFHANAWGVPYTAAMLGVKMVFQTCLHPDLCRCSSRK